MTVFILQIKNGQTVKAWRRNAWAGTGNVLFYELLVSKHIIFWDSLFK